MENFSGLTPEEKARLLDLEKKYEITDNWIASKSGWTPYDNLEVKGMPIITIVNGKVVMRDNEIINESCGEKVEFIY